jgi:RNA polymerase sigma-70 factor (ECF subfamily)
MERGPGDAELISAIPTSAEAFDAFYRRHIDAVLRFLARRCATPEDVADAAAATFVAVLTSSWTFRPERGNPRSWLLSIAANEARKLVSKRGRQRAVALRAEGRDLLSPDDAQRIAEMIDAEREARRLEPALESARPSERKLLAVMAGKGLSVAEASRVLGIDPGAGRARLARLRSLARSTGGRRSPSPHPSTATNEEHDDDAGH